MSNSCPHYYIEKIPNSNHFKCRTCENIFTKIKLDKEYKINLENNEHYLEELEEGILRLETELEIVSKDDYNPNCDEEDIEEYRKIDIESCEDEIAEYEKERRVIQERINTYTNLIKKINSIEIYES